MQHKLSILPSTRQPVWLTQPLSDGYIRIPRNMLLAAIVSLLVHVLLLFFLYRQHLFDQEVSIPLPQGPLVVNLQRPAPPHVETPAQPVLPEPLPPETPKPKRRPPTPVSKPRVQPQPQRLTPPTITAKEPSKASPLPTEAAPAPAPSPPPKPAALDPSQFPDMAAYVRAMREQRHAVGDSDGDTGQDEIKKANLKHPSGTNGVFQILSMDAHSARLSFLGWKGEFSYSRRETYEVDAKIGEDIHRAIVRKMIEIIRRYYDGDFNWESPRLGRVVVLSARLQDNDGLEDFLMQEFFVTPGLQY